MSVQDLGSAAEHYPLPTLGALAPGAQQARRATAVPLTDGPKAAGEAASGEAVGPWGPRPAPARQSIAMHMLRGVDRIALAVVYAAVCVGLPLAFVGLATGVI